MNQINAQSAGQAIGKLKSHAVTQEMLVMHRKCYLRAGIPREDPVAQNTNASSPSIVCVYSERLRFAHGSGVASCPAASIASLCFLVGVDSSENWTRDWLESS